MIFLSSILRELKAAARRAGIVMMSVVIAVNGTLFASVPMAQADLVSGAPVLAAHFDFYMDPADQSFTPVVSRPEGERDGANPFGYSQPLDVTYNSGLMKVVDTGNSRIVSYGLAGNRWPISVAGQDNYHGSETGGTPDRFQVAPTYAFEAHVPLGGYYVSTGNQIRHYLLDDVGEEPLDVIGDEDGGAGASDFTTVGGMGQSGESEQVFVADTGNNRVLAFDAATFGPGAVATRVLGQPDFDSTAPGLAADRMNGPTDVYVDSNTDRLYVADTGNARVLIWNVNATATGSAAQKVLGQPDFDTATCAADAAHICTPVGLSIDEEDGDWLYVSDSQLSRVARFDVSSFAGIVNGMDADAVIGQPDFSGQTETTSQTGLKQPHGIDSANELIVVADTGNNRIMVFAEADIDADGSGVPAVDVHGQIDADDLDPWSMIGEYGKGEENAIPLRTSTVSHFGQVAWDAGSDHLFLADFRRVLVFDATPAGGFASDTPAFVIGQESFDDLKSGAAADRLDGALDISFDPGGGLLWVADSGNNRVLAFDVGAGVVNGQDAVVVLGQPNFGSAAPDVDIDRFNQPTGVVVDTANNKLYVTDQGNNRVLRFSLSGISTGDEAELVIGQPDFADAAPGLAADRFNGPWNADVGDGKLFVADGGNNRVLVFDTGTLTDGASAINVLGQNDFVSNEAGVGVGLFSFPTDVEYDPSTGQIFVNDVGNSRVLDFDGLNIDDGDAAMHVIGQPDFEANDEGVYDAVGFEDVLSIGHLDGSGILYVGDGDVNRIMEFDSFFEYTLGDDQSEGGEGGSGGGGPGPGPGDTNANSIVMTRLKAGEESTMLIGFELATPASTPLTVTLPAAFTILTPATAELSSDCLSNFAFDDSAHTLTADKDACDGELVLGGMTVVNPALPGAYMITWENDQPGFGAVYIVDDDQVTIRGRVSPKITFDIDVGETGTEDVGPEYVVDMGELVTGDVRASGTDDGINRIMLDLSTNATSGAVVTVASQNGDDGLVSVSAGDSIPSGAFTMTAGTAGYGLCVSSVAADSGTLAAAGLYVGNDCAPDADGNEVEELSTGGDPIISTAGPIKSGRAEIIVNAAISSSTPAHSDYQDVLTFIATATF